MHKVATEDILKSVIVETDMGVQNGLTHTRLQPNGNIRTCTVKHSHPSNPGSYIYSCAILFWERRSRGFPHKVLQRHFLQLCLMIGLGQCLSSTLSLHTCMRNLVEHAIFPVCKYLQNQDHRFWFPLSKDSSALQLPYEVFQL